MREHSLKKFINNNGITEHHTRVRGEEKILSEFVMLKIAYFVDNCDVIAGLRNRKGLPSDQ